MNNLQRVDKPGRIGPRPLDLTGNRYGKLTVVRFLRIEKERAVWLCACDCGNEVEKTSNILRHQETGHHCGCRVRELPPMELLDLQGAVFSKYRREARKRGLTFELALLEFVALGEQPCRYCRVEHSLEVSRRGLVWRYNGIDRIDNRIGYAAPNCAPCCFTCNRAKGQMSHDAFVEWIRRVFANLG